MTSSPMHSGAELEAARLKAVAIFRRERLEEPLEDYLDHFDDYQGVFEELLEVTVDLTALNQAAPDPAGRTALDDLVAAILSGPGLLEAFRYLAGPPISTDDLKVVAEANSLLPSRLRNDPALSQRLVEVVLTALDRRRFPWLTEGREPTESERSAAVLASAALLATRRMEANRRSTGKGLQERQVEEELVSSGLRKVSTRQVGVLADAPGPGEFCRESMLGNRKADFLVRLWDRRVMAIECKVSNSATNSVKRLNNDAAAKAEAWRRDFGLTQVVPAAVLSGVYKLHNLEDAQLRGLSIFWAHDLGALTRWIEATRPPGARR